MIVTSLIERFELAEAEMLANLGATTAPTLVAELGVVQRRFGRGVVVVVGNDPSNFWSQAHGFGLDRPLDAETVGDVLEFTRANGGSAMNFYLTAETTPADWDEISTEFGLKPTFTRVKVAREAAPVAPVETDLRIAPIGPGDVAAWSAVQGEAFGVSTTFAELLGSFTQAPGATGYGAWDGDTLVAAGALWVHGEVAELVSGATLPSYRGRGAQSALLARRLTDAYAAGARWAVAETSKPEPGEHNTSLANMERAGLLVAYDQQAYAWTAS